MVKEVQESGVFLAIQPLESARGERADQNLSAKDLAFRERRTSKSKKHLRYVLIKALPALDSDPQTMHFEVSDVPGFIRNVLGGQQGKATAVAALTEWWKKNTSGIRRVGYYEEDDVGEMVKYIFTPQHESSNSEHESQKVSNDRSSRDEVDSGSRKRPRDSDSDSEDA
ncbi:MAG: hypothetical protein Q9201_001522 [Fulgogasparrea decipioides]